jgi:hypothetical protein
VYFSVTQLQHKQKVYKEYCLSLRKKEKKSENHPEYSATIFALSTSISPSVCMPFCLFTRAYFSLLETPCPTLSHQV